MTESEIAARLIAAIENAARDRGVVLGDGNQSALPALARSAATDIVQSTSAPEELAELVGQGESAYDTLVGSMVQAADSLPDYPRGIIGERTLDIALARLGRFPPFW